MNQNSAGRIHLVMPAPTGENECRTKCLHYRRRRTDAEDPELERWMRRLWLGISLAAGFVVWTYMLEAFAAWTQ